MNDLSLEIIDYGYNGEGVAKDNGKVYFVPKVLIGEKVKVDILKNASKFSYCEAKKIILPSPLRLVPRCPYFFKCGGCNFQHMNYEFELSLKKQLLLRDLRKIYNLSDLQVVSCGFEYAYRNKVRFQVKDNKLGFFENRSNNFIEIEHCDLISSEMNRIITVINEKLSQLEYRFKEVILFSFNGKIVVDFVTHEKVDKKVLQQIFDFDFMINHKGQTFRTKFMGLEYDFSGDAFRQVNDEVAEKLYGEVLANLKGKRIANCYSGIGVLSGLLSKEAEHVYGIELNSSAHNGAESLKEINKIQNLTNICGYVEKELHKIAGKVDFVVLDPPRAGCDISGLNAILENNIPGVVYISCNPSTLMRDLKILLEKYDIKSVKLFDMFPRTANFETLVVLEAK